MKDNPQYITQISSDWIKKVSRHSNLIPGPGIKITHESDGVKIEVDQETFKQWIWKWINSYTHTSNTKQLSELQNIILDPGSQT